MKRMLLAGLVMAYAVGAGVAADPIHERKELMEANGKVTKSVVAIMKGASPFKLETVQAALKTYADSAEKMPALFPPGSDKGKTDALPAVWRNKADFDAKFAKFGADAKAAMETIKDAETFKATFPGVLKNCNGCHETYRKKE